MMYMWRRFAGSWNYNLPLLNITNLMDDPPRKPFLEVKLNYET